MKNNSPFGFRWSFVMEMCQKSKAATGKIARYRNGGQVDLGVTSTHGWCLWWHCQILINRVICCVTFIPVFSKDACDDYPRCHILDAWKCFHHFRTWSASRLVLMLRILPGIWSPCAVPFISTVIPHYMFTAECNDGYSIGFPSWWMFRFCCEAYFAWITKFQTYFHGTVHFTSMHMKEKNEDFSRSVTSDHLNAHFVGKSRRTTTFPSDGDGSS